MNNEARKALADYAAAKKTAENSTQEAVAARWRFLGQFFGETPDEADAAWEILSKHHAEQYYREQQMLRDNVEKKEKPLEDLRKKCFFGNLYEKLYGGKR